jgi:cyclophilin family peptidyl-prolyl cis-trans isomerase/HEAT repeat protein/thiol-disulfide isomerase/thioredoxin
MRKLLPLLVFLACTTAPPPAPAPAPAPASHGLTIEEEARILALEDRREFDPTLGATWVAHANALHRNRIALALGRIGPHTFIDANNNGERDPGERQAGVDLLASIARDTDPTVRATVAFALGEIGDAAAIDTLFQLAADENASVASEAVEGLSKMAAQVPLARYTALTASGADGVRARAIRFLFRFNTDEASAIAAAALDSSSPVIAQEAVYALSRRAHAPARENLELLLTGRNTMSQAYAATALGRIAAPESMPALIRALADVHPWVRTNAIVAVARVAAKDATAVSATDVPRILATTEDFDTGTRALSIDTLGYYAVKNETSRKRLLDIAANGTRWERELAAGAIGKHLGEQPLPATLTNWAKVRVIEGAPALRRLFVNDSDPMVRANAIGAIPDEAVDAEMPTVRRALDDPDAIIRSNAIDRYATSTRETDAKLVTLTAAEQRARTDTRENDARLSAIRGIAAIDHANREAFLRALLGDSDPVVRRLAADLIEQTLKKNRPQYTPLPVSGANYAQIVTWSRQPHTATIHMTRGVIELALLTQEAPMTAWNFAQLAQRKYFDNTTFMRVVPNFVIQGGDPRNDQNGGPGYAIRDEINLQKYTRGAVGMALSGPDTGGSQFFITHSAQPHLDGGYTIFGRVYDGMIGVVDQTERGDRVETITIDERPAVRVSELPTPGIALPLEVGPMTAARLIEIVPEYEQRKREYTPDTTVVEMIASAIQPADRLEVYSGTWCPDSQRELPKLLKIEEVLREKFSKNIPATFVAVDRSKTKPEALLAGKHIEKIPTIIYYRGDQELGRIVERPNSLFEDDLLVILSKDLH